ncbi:MAG TPA: cytochrome C, partial [Geobacteraceae bacterium]
MAKQEKHFLGYFFNIISLIGMILAALATGLMIAFFSYEMMTGIESPYLGMMTYFLFPGMLIFGLFLIPIGALNVRNKRRLMGD